MLNTNLKPPYATSLVRWCEREIQQWISLLDFIEENVEIKGTIRLENKGKLKLNLGDYKLINTTSENIEELVITSTDSEDNTGLIKDIRLDSVLINKGVVKLKGNNVVGKLNIEETQLDLDEKSELVSNEVFIKSINRDFNLMGKITVQDSFIYNGKCITLDKESSIISKDGNIEISLLNCNLSHNGYIWSGKDLKLELEKGYLANKGIIGADGIGNILVKESGAKLINSGSIQGGVDFTVRLEANGKVENEKDGVINGKGNIKIIANSIINQAGGKISSVNGIELDITKLINSGAIYYKEGKLNIRDALINHALIIGEELTDIKMGGKGEIHNNENARIKLGGKVYIGGNDDKNISLLRNYAASIAITGEELTLNVDKIDNLAREEGYKKEKYDCMIVDAENKGATYFHTRDIQTISYIKYSNIRLEGNSVTINGKIINKSSLFSIQGKLVNNSKISIENIAKSLVIEEHNISMFYYWEYYPGDEYMVPVSNEKYLRNIGDDLTKRGRQSDFILKFKCIKASTEAYFNDNIIQTTGSNSQFEAFFKNPILEIILRGQEAIRYINEDVQTNNNFYNTRKGTTIYKTYPSTVAFTDVEGARVAGLSNYAVAKSELSKLLDEFKDNSNALVPYDLKSQEIEEFKLSAIDMMNSLRKEGYEIRLDNVFNFGGQSSQEARFLRYFFEQYNPGIYKVNTPNQLAIGDGSCGDSCALAGDGTGLVASGGLVTNYIFESIFELPGMKQKGTAYLLKELGYSTGDIIQILADPDYEHEVLKRAIFDKLGKAYIWNHKKNDDEEFDQLLKNAVTAKRDLGLIPGIELTRWQQSELVDAILWPVKENINEIEAWSLRLYVTEEILKDGYSSATIALKDTTLIIDEDVFNGGLIDSIGDTFIEARNIYQLNQIKGSGSLNVEARGSFIMEMLVKVIEQYSSNSHKVSYVPMNSPAVDLSGSFKVNSKGNIGVKGGEIKANTIAIESGDKVIVIPAAIYNKLYYSWGDGYSRSESLEYELARIMASGDIKIVSQNGNYLYSPIIKTEGEFELEAKLGKNVIEAVANKYISERYEDDSWFVFSSETYSYSSITNIIRPFISAAKKVVFGSLEDTAIRAAIITTSSMEIKTGKDDIVGLISLLPGKNILLKEEWGESDYVIRSKKYVGKSVSEEIVPTIIQINNDCKGLEDEKNVVKTMDGKCATFIGYGSGGWLQLASKVEAETIEIKAPKGIKLVAAPELDFSYAAVDKKGIGFAFTSNSREQSVGLGIKVSKSRETSAEAIHRVSSLVGHFITLDTDETIYTEGAYIKAEEKLTTRSKLEIHDVVYDTKTHSQRKVEGFLGLKLGIQNSIAGLIESGKSVDKSIRQGGKEGAINTAFAAWDAYNTLMGIAAGGGLFQGGVWLSASYSESSNELDKRTVKFTTIEVGKEEDGKLKEGTYESTSEELRLKSTQIKAYDAYFNTNKLTTNTANNEEHRRSQGGGINIQVGMSGTVGSNVGGNTGKLNSDEIVPIHAEIYVTNRLELKVKGHADIKGTFIEAKSLEASFESLILESVKELEESSGRSFGLSKGWGNSVSKNYGGSFEVSSGKRNVVSKLTRLVGQEDTNIIVAHALELNGAMIANAEVDEEGNYKDVGNLILTVGELFVKHVYDSDEGHTLGASINYITENKGSDGKISKYGVVIGGRDGDGYTFATIGKGEVKCTESEVNKVCEIEKANRDVSKTSSFDYNYKIETIRAKFSSLNEETKKKAIENLKSGKFFENIATSFMDAVGEVGEALGNILPNKESITQDEKTKFNPKDQVFTNNKYARKNTLDELSEIDQKILEKYPELNGDIYKKLSIIRLAHHLESNNLVLDRNGAIDTAYAAVSKYMSENPVIRPAALPLAAMGIGQAIRSCATSSACVKAVLEISIGAAAWLGIKITTDKLNEESYKDSNDDISKDKQQTQQEPGTAVASSGAPDPDDDFDPDEEENLNNEKSTNQLNQEIKKGQAPKEIKRVDKANPFIKGQKTHVHFNNGAALNKDGTWREGFIKLTKKQRLWLQKNGWKLPND
ncbi:hemagglutinin repeat-containing protein [Candidatus Bandiella euplotis]|uniref:Hemagglutinin repeat protein n=1 Tax=Candidatus Bandiella euplotis TaxID=1664265 RepID=A0ABZ0UNX2_9RICK|nr:hemagglutinin repeat-containing protein [Candidatus Bandiella woodruffii]WPX97402.1 Putative hemagglutinin repeat protein [Candidatus Bandiella woodruffii]